MQAIELTQPRVIVIEDRKRKYQLTVARISKKQWTEYFNGIVHTSENQGGKRVNLFDSSSASLTLVEQLLADATGYSSSSPLPSGWQTKLPLAHRLGVANTLMSAAPSEKDQDSEDEPLTLGRETTFLDAIWGADEQGIMRKFRGLRHTFATPSAEHQRRYSRDSSRSRIVGGSRNSKTQWLGAQIALMDLYDELIQEVEGYTVNGSVPDRQGIVDNMDGYHKVAAADQLFAPIAPVITDDGEEKKDQ